MAGAKLIPEVWDRYIKFFRGVSFCKDICLIYIAHTWLTAHLYRIEIANICMKLAPSFMSRFIAKYLYMEGNPCAFTITIDVNKMCLVSDTKFNKYLTFNAKIPLFLKL